MMQDRTQASKPYVPAISTAGACTLNYWQTERTDSTSTMQATAQLQPDEHQQTQPYIRGLRSWLDVPRIYAHASTSWLESTRTLSRIGSKTSSLMPSLLVESAPSLACIIKMRVSRTYQSKPCSAAVTIVDSTCADPSCSSSCARH